MTKKTGFFYQLCSGILKWLVLIYQWTIGLILPPRCRFYPSCSEYAREALKVHPLHYALWLILKRLLKCQPLCEGGIDLVPPRKG